MSPMAQGQGLGQGSVDVVLQHLLGVLSTWWPIIFAFAYLIGLWIVIHGLLVFSHPEKFHGRSHGSSLARAGFMIFAGSMLLALPSFMNTLTTSFFHANAPSTALAYAPSATGKQGVGTEIRFAVVAIHVLGLIAVINGLMHLARSSEGGGYFGSAVVRLISGGIALRIGLFISALGVSMGPSVSSFVTRFFS